MDDGADGAGDGGEDEAEGDAVDAAEFDVVFAEEGVHSVGEDGNHDDDGQRIEVCEEIVWRAVGGHRSALVGKSVANATIIGIPDREVEKDGAGSECSLGIVDKLISPRNRFTTPGGNALSGKDGWLLPFPSILCPRLCTCSALVPCQRSGRSL